METYKLLVESYLGGRGRTLSPSQVTDLLQLFSAMDAEIGELMSDVVEGEVLDVDAETDTPGLDSEVAGVDAQVEGEES